MVPLFFRGSFACNGKWAYEDHVATIRGLGLPPDRFLEWTVKDGWQPLCKFLGRDIPDEPFPKGNSPVEYAEKLPRVLQDFEARAKRNMMWTSTALVLGLGLFIAIVQHSRG